MKIKLGYLDIRFCSLHTYYYMDYDNDNEIETQLNVDQITPEYIHRLETLNLLLENRVKSNELIIKNLKKKYSEIQRLKEGSNQTSSTIVL